MTRRTLCLAAIAAAAFCLLVAPASATHLQCGQTLTQSVSLDGDIQCASGQPVGLNIAADDVLVKMNGYTIHAAPDAGRQRGRCGGTRIAVGLLGRRGVRSPGRTSALLHRFRPARPGRNNTTWARRLSQDSGRSAADAGFNSLPGPAICKS